MDNPALLTVDQVAEKLGISKHRVYRRIHRGDIPARPSRKGNAHYLVSEDDLQSYITAAQGHTDLTEPKIAPSPFLSTAEAAMATGFSVETIRHMCYEGQLPYIRSGGKPRGHLRIPRTAVQELLNRHGIY